MRPLYIASRVDGLISFFSIIGSLKQSVKNTSRQHRAPNALLLPFFYQSDLHQFVAPARKPDPWAEPGRAADRPELLKHMAGMRSRLRWQRGIIITVRAALLGSLALLLGAVAVSVGALGAASSAQIAALCILGFGVALALFQRITYLETAKVVDRQGGLQERLATAVELSLEGRQGYLAEAQAQEARLLAARLRPSRALPARFPWKDFRSLAVALALVAGLTMLNGNGLTLASLYPSLQQNVLAKTPAAPATLGQKDADISAWEEPRQQAGAAGAESGSPSAKTLARVVRAEALAEELERLGMASAAQALAESLEQNDLARARAEISNLADQAQKLSPEGKRELAADARQAASRLAEKNPGLAQDLSDLADALSSGDKQSVQKALDQLQKQMNPSGQQNQAQSAQRSEQSQQGSQPQNGRDGNSGPGNQPSNQNGQPGQDPKQTDREGTSSPGSGSGAGRGDQGDLRRLDGQDQKVQVQSQKDRGDSQFQRLNSGSTPRVGDTQASQAASANAGSSQPVGIAADSHYVPWDLKEVVSNYFSSQEGR